jgi:formylglycine-generating enzyme required for sulfatase activity
MERNISAWVIHGALTLIFLASWGAAARALAAGSSRDNSGMVLIPAGTYVPFFLEKTSPKQPAAPHPKQVSAFWMDREPVTQKEFVLFLKKNPQWTKSAAKAVFVDEHYLENWQGNVTPPPGQSKSPVVFVSWFAATAYCHSLGKSLPTLDQWEYVADDHGRGLAASKQKILEWYGRPSSEKLPSVGKEPANGYGVSDLFGLIWEWTEDFNSALIDEGAAAGSSADRALFCGGGALLSRDPADAARFMRYSFRSSLKANYSIGDLGFRCAKEAP